MDEGTYIESLFLDPQGDHAVAYATVKTSGVRLRSSPGKEAKVLRTLDKGAGGGAAAGRGVNAGEGRQPDRLRDEPVSAIPLIRRFSQRGGFLGPPRLQL